MAGMMVVKTTCLSLSVSLEVVDGASFFPESGSCSLISNIYHFVWLKKDPKWSCTFRKHWIEIIRTQIQQLHPQNVSCNLLHPAADMTVDQTSVSRTSPEFVADRNLYPVWSTTSVVHLDHASKPSKGWSFGKAAKANVNQLAGHPQFCLLILKLQSKNAFNYPNPILLFSPKHFNCCHEIPCVAPAGSTGSTGSTAALAFATSGRRSARLQWRSRLVRDPLEVGGWDCDAVHEKLLQLIPSGKRSHQYGKSQNHHF